MTFKQESCTIKTIYKFRNKDFTIRFQLVTKDTNTRLRWLEIDHDKGHFTYKVDEDVRDLPKSTETFAFAYAREGDSGKVLTSIWPKVYNVIQNAARKLEKPIPSNDYVSDGAQAAPAANETTGG